MKKVIALAFAVLICVSLAACSGNSKNEPAELTNEDYYLQLTALAEEGKYDDAAKLAYKGTSLKEYKDAADYFNYCEAMKMYENGGIGKAYSMLKTAPEILKTKDTLAEIEAKIGALEGHYVEDNGRGAYLHIYIRDGKVATEVESQYEDVEIVVEDEDYIFELVLSEFTTGEKFIGIGNCWSASEKPDVDYVVHTYEDSTDIMVIAMEGSEYDTFNGLYEKQPS